MFKKMASKRRISLLIFTLIFVFIFLLCAQTEVTAYSDYIRAESGIEHKVFGFNQPRGSNQLIVYTPEYGKRTRTNPWGAEAIVKNDRVTEIRQGFLTEMQDSPIPENGYVVSGHGGAKEWINSNLEKGMKVELVEKGRTKVGILVSGYNLHWYNQMGLDAPDWAYFQEMQNLVELVRNLGYKVVLFSDKDLEQAYDQSPQNKGFVNLAEIKTLILPNTRRISSKQVKNVRQFVNKGGTVLATMQASFRNASDQKVGSGNYQLDSIFKVTYDSFSWEQGQHAYIKASKEHEIWQGLPETVENERGWAMVNRPKPEGRVLGTWLTSSEEKSHPDEKNAAIVEGKRTLYVGEQLLTPENFQNEGTRELLGNMIKYLYRLEKNFEGSNTAEIAGQNDVEEAGTPDTENQNSLGIQLLAGAGMVAAVVGYFIFTSN